MTPEEFEKVILTGDSIRVAEACASLDEKQRRKLSKTAADTWRELKRRKQDYDSALPENPLWKRLKKFGTFNGRADLSMPTAVAVLAVCPLSVARKIGGFDHPAVIKVLRDRRPEWIDQWVEERLQAGWRGIEWNFLRALIKEGVCRKPTSDEYIFLMAAGPETSWVGKAVPPLSRWLLDEPDLLEDVWRLFEVETPVFSGGPDDYTWAVEGRENWPTALTKLAAEGHLDRGRLLDSSLAALDNDFKNNTLSGYAQFFQKLEPTDDELAARQRTLLDLLSSRVSHIVTFSLKMLKRIEKSKLLDGEAFIGAVSPVFDVKTKGQPKTALALIGQTTKRQPDLVPWAFNAVVAALSHEATDVQEKAIGLLESWVPRAHSDHAAALRERLDDLAPSVQGRARQFLAQIGGQPPTDDQQEQPTDAQDESLLKELLDRADRIDPHWRAVAGVDEAVAAVRSHGMAGPLEFDILDVPLLTATERIQPIQTVDELIDAVAHAVEEVDSADELERILDGISRLGNQRPADFERRTEPLRKRMRDLHASKEGRGITDRWTVPSNLLPLVMAWLRGNSPSPPKHQSKRKDVRPFFEGRLEEQAESLRVRGAAPLLSAPTHAHGWIEPIELVNRVALFQRQRLDVPPYDFVLAILRLAPDRRAQALEAAADLSDNVGRILRWALGDDQGPSRRDKRDAALWLAAGRAREPRGHLDELAAVGFKATVPDAITPAAYSWESRFQRPFWASDGQLLPHIEIMTEPPPIVRTRLALEVTTGLHNEPRAAIAHIFHAAWAIEWRESLWPQCIDPFLAESVRFLMSRLDSEASAFDPHRAFFHPLFEPDQPWSEMAYLAVCVGLLTKDSDSHAAAMDALIEATQDGRADPTRMGPTLVGIAAGGWVKMNRLADAMREVARLSPLHAWMAAETLIALVGGFDPLPRDAHHVLTLLLELLTDLGLALDGPARQLLLTVKGSSKTAKSAKALLALEHDGASAAIRRAAIQALETRIDRAERWGGN